MLVGERIERRAQPFRLRLTRLLQRLLGLGQQRADVALEALSTDCLPIGFAHLLHHQLHDLAAALLDDEHAIGLFFCLEVADAEVEQVPRERQVSRPVVLIGRVRRLQ